MWPATPRDGVRPSATPIYEPTDRCCRRSAEEIEAIATRDRSDPQSKPSLANAELRCRSEFDVVKETKPPEVQSARGAASRLPCARVVAADGRVLPVTKLATRPAAVLFMTTQMPRRPSARASTPRSTRSTLRLNAAGGTVLANAQVRKSCSVDIVHDRFVADRSAFIQTRKQQVIPCAGGSRRRRCHHANVHQRWERRAPGPGR